MPRSTAEIIGRLFPSLLLFTYFQLMDAMTTLIGLKAGMCELNPFIKYFMRLGPAYGLLLSKTFAFLLAAAAIWFGRPRAIVRINYFFGALVLWNAAFLTFMIQG